MVFGQSAGPPATSRQLAELLELLQVAGRESFHDARGPMRFTQRQAAGKFTAGRGGRVDRSPAGVVGRRGGAVDRTVTTVVRCRTAPTRDPFGATGRRAATARLARRRTVESPRRTHPGRSHEVWSPAACGNPYGALTLHPTRPRSASGPTTVRPLTVRSQRGDQAGRGAEGRRGCQRRRPAPPATVKWASDTAWPSRCVEQSRGTVDQHDEARPRRAGPTCWPSGRSPSRRPPGRSWWIAGVHAETPSGSSSSRSASKSPAVRRLRPRPPRRSRWRAPSLVSRRRRGEWWMRRRARLASWRCGVGAAVDDRCDRVVAARRSRRGGRTPGVPVAAACRARAARRSRCCRRARRRPRVAGRDRSRSGRARTCRALARGGRVAAEPVEADAAGDCREPAAGVRR